MIYDIHFSVIVTVFLHADTHLSVTLNIAPKQHNATHACIIKRQTGLKNGMENGLVEGLTVICLSK